jgi:hypothetical protein
MSSLTRASTYTAIAYLSLSAVTAPSEEPSNRRLQARQTIEKRLDSLGKFKVGKRLKLEDLESEHLRRIFDGCEFFLFRFPSYPVEVVPIAPLGRNNIFAVCGGEVVQISDETALESFFLNEFPVANDATTMADGVRCWLQIAKELQQDGFITFNEPSINVEGSSAKGKVEAIKGTGGGSVSVVMHFSNGKLTKLDRSNGLVPGVRKLK